MKIKSSSLQNSSPHPDFATPAGVTAPIFRKWALVWEEHQRAVVRQGAATRVAHTRRAAGGGTVRRAPPWGGRVSFQVSVDPATATASVNVTLPAGLRWPAGGICIRVAHPCTVERPRI